MPHWVGVALSLEGKLLLRGTLIGWRKSHRNLMRFSTGECRVLALVWEAILLPSSLGINCLKGIFLKKDLMALVDKQRGHEPAAISICTFAVKGIRSIMRGNSVSVASRKEVVISEVGVSLFSQATRDRKRKWSQIVPGKV